MEEEGELEGVERSGPAEKCPHPQATLSHLRESHKHVTEAPCPKLRPKGERNKGQAKEARGLRAKGPKALRLMLSRLELPQHQSA